MIKEEKSKYIKMAQVNKKDMKVKLKHNYLIDLQICNFKHNGI